MNNSIEDFKHIIHGCQCDFPNDFYVKEQLIYKLLELFMNLELKFKCCDYSTLVYVNKFIYNGDNYKIVVELLNNHRYCYAKSETIKTLHNKRNIFDKNKLNISVKIIS